MKYVVVLYDGMADYPVPALGGKTPMMCAKKPNMDFLAKRSEVGLIKTVADGLKPGSDVANMSVLGFDPMKYYTGRSPLEAASIGIDMKPSDVSLRTNLVTLSEDDLPYEQKTIEDYCADDISTEEAELIEQYLHKYYLSRLEQEVFLLTDDREREIILKRYGLCGNEPHTQKEVAAMMGISRSYVSRIEKKALEKLRSSYEQYM